MLLWMPCTASNSGKPMAETSAAAAAAHQHRTALGKDINQLGHKVCVLALLAAYKRRTTGPTNIGTRSPEERAETPVWLATLPDDGPTGGFFLDRQVVPWY